MSSLCSSFCVRRYSKNAVFMGRLATGMLTLLDNSYFRYARPFVSQSTSDRQWKILVFKRISTASNNVSVFSRVPSRSTKSGMSCPELVNFLYLNSFKNELRNYANE